MSQVRKIDKAGKLKVYTNSERRIGWGNDPVVRDYVYELIRTGYARGMSDNEIADYAGVTTKTALLWRGARGLPPNALG